MKKLWINYLINNLLKMRPSIVLAVIKHQAILTKQKILYNLKILTIKIKRNHQWYKCNKWKKISNLMLRSKQEVW